MKNLKENTAGAVAYIDTTSIAIPEVQGQVTNELWVDMNPYEVYRNYLETGQLGHGNSCCLHPFWAETLNGAQTKLVEWYAEEPGNHYNYYEVSDGYHNGEWNVYWQPAPHSPVKTVPRGLWPAFSTLMLVGAEMAGETEPVNSGLDESAAISSANNSWTEWKSVYGGHGEEKRSPGLCWARNPYSPHYGNISWSACHSTFAVTRSTGQEVPAGQITLKPLPTGAELSNSAIEDKALAYAAQAGKAAESAGVKLARGPLAVAENLLSENPAAFEQRTANLATALVVLHGSYESKLVLPGANPVTGSVLALIVDAHTGDVIGEYIGNTEPNISTLAQTARAHQGIAGRVVDVSSFPGSKKENVVPISGAVVHVGRYKTRTGTGGKYKINIPPGGYTVTATSRFSNTPCHVGHRVRVRPRHYTYVEVTCSGITEYP